jgi:glycosyltransferase involved in cell wall biosynthesis
MRFHVLGVSFAPTNREFSADGFSQKVRLFCKMMTERGHTVYHYGIEGSDPICTENINVVSRETYERVHFSYDYKEYGFSYLSDTDAQDEFNRNAIIEIGKRKKNNDFICCSFGFPQKPIVDAHPDLFDCEIGIGFDGSVVKYRIFESYAWMHVIYGKENRLSTPVSFYDAVIPNYYDLDDYIYSSEKDDYFFFIARMAPLKGLEIALKSAEHVGAKLIVAGTGTPHLTSPNLVHVGVVNFEERARLMSKARATFVPTNYIEPFGSTVIESLLCGTPVISTDFGAFTETVQHGLVGYRCRTLEQFYWATENIDKIKPLDCRNYAIKNYSINRIGEMYEEFFGNILKLAINGDEGWYQPNLNRKELNWLNKYIPEIKPIEIVNKKLICFYIGYTPDLHSPDVTNTYGAEITTVRLAEEFAKNKKNRVLIFGATLEIELIKNGVEYYNSERLDSFQESNQIDIMIISRYVNYFLDFESNAKKTFLWVHDLDPLPFYKGKTFAYNGKPFLKNIIHKLDGIIALTQWHKSYLIEKYNIPKEKVFVINSAITPEMFKGDFKKIPHKFIWTSHGYRGLNEGLSVMHKIHSILPDSQLYIYRDVSSIPLEALEEIEKFDYLHYGGRLEHKDIMEQFESAQVWIYPTSFLESYCMSAVEAQMAKCLCVTSKYGALIETVGNRGLMIDGTPSTEEFQNKMVQELIDLLSDDNKMNKMLELGYLWAKEQTWDKRAEEWVKLFKK